MKPHVQKVKRKIKKPLTRREVKTNRAKTDKAFLGFLEEKKSVHDDEPALDIQVDTAKPFEFPHGWGLLPTSDPNIWVNMHGERFAWDGKLQQPEKIKPAPIHPDFYTAPYPGSEAEPEKKGNFMWIVLLLIVAFMAISYAAGKYDRFPRIEYRDKVEYRYEVKELPENPWGPRKIPLLPEDVEILEGR